MNQILQDCLNQVNPDIRAEVRKNMTMTRELDARAKAYAKMKCDEYGDEEEIFSFYYEEYLEIAEEQKAIDIDKACAWIDEYFPIRGNGESTFIRIEAVKECFRKAMEE